MSTQRKKRTLMVQQTAGIKEKTDDESQITTPINSIENGDQNGDPTVISNSSKIGIGTDDHTGGGVDLENGDQNGIGDGTGTDDRDNGYNGLEGTIITIVQDGYNTDGFTSVKRDQDDGHSDSLENGDQTDDLNGSKMVTGTGNHADDGDGLNGGNPIGDSIGENDGPENDIQNGGDNGDPVVTGTITGDGTENGNSIDLENGIIPGGEIGNGDVNGDGTSSDNQNGDIEGDQSSVPADRPGPKKKKKAAPPAPPQKKQTTKLTHYVDKDVADRFKEFVIELDGGNIDTKLYSYYATIALDAWLKKYGK